MVKRIEINGLKVAKELHDFVANEAIPGTGLDAVQFWSGFAQIVEDLAPKNRALLQKRDAFQKKLDDFYKSKRDIGCSHEEYETFLKGIRYLLPEGEAFAVSTSNVDPEIAVVAGPQLVVPVMNARYALNAANARWGSLYDALYGTDAISDEDGAERGKAFNPVRGSKVIAWAKAFLDDSAPLDGAHWADVSGLSIENHKLMLKTNGKLAALKDEGQFAGYRGDTTAPTAILLVKNGLYVEIVINADHPIGKNDPAHIADVLLESALTTIQDCEDSVAAVDAEDKVVVYRNWLGLMNGDLEDTFEKGGKTVTRKLNADRAYTASDRTWTLADAGAQCRPSDDQSCHPRRGRQRGSRRYYGCSDYRAGCAPRHRTRRPPYEFPRRIHVCGQTKNARSRRGSIHFRAVWKGRSAAGYAAQHHEDGNHG
jgi:malate synthase